MLEKYSQILEKEGKITRPKLGVSISSASTKLELYYQSVILLPNDISEGIVVVAVEAGSAAERAGLKKGDVIMLHSSLSSMKYVDGGANTLIQALLDVLTPSGTLLLPSFTYIEVTKTLVFDINNSKVCVGVIPETFRNYKGVIRSMHPTHSVCAIGKYANDLLKDHYLDNTPMGINSPFRKLVNYNGKLLMLGCGLYCNSFIHAVEEICDVSYCLDDFVTYTLIDKENNVIKKDYRPHNFQDVIQRYDRTLDVLSLNDYNEGFIHNAKSYLIDCKALSKKAINKIKEDNFYFVDKKGEI